MIVVDTSALAALFRSEPGHHAVSGHLNDACISSVNLSELIGVMARYGSSPPQTIASFEGLGVPVIPFDIDQAKIAGTYIMPGRPLSIGLGDCCCIALAIARQLPVLTGDRTWQQLGLPIPVVLFR